MTDQYVVLGLARVRSGWFRDMGRWSTSAALPVDFVKCVSLDELVARLASGRPHSAILVDSAVAGFDRDLTDLARSAGCAVIAVDDGTVRRAWTDLGVDAVLPEPTSRQAVLSVLREHAQPVVGFDFEVGPSPDEPALAGWRGRMVVFVGAGGTGTSTLAMAAAQTAARDPRHGGRVLLADLARHADLALLHDSGDIVPGVQELVEEHRSRNLGPDEVRSLTFSCEDRGYDLLLGLRRPSDWSAVRPRAFAAALRGLLGAFRLTVADVDADLEGERDGGSVDVEERNVMTRTALEQADAVVVVGAASVSGLHRFTRLLDEILRFGVDPTRLLPVVNRSPRGPRVRAEITGAVHSSIRALQGAPVSMASPLHVPERRSLEDAHRDARPLPRPFATPIGAAVDAILQRVEGPPRAAEPEPVVPGSLGAWRATGM